MTEKHIPMPPLTRLRNLPLVSICIPAYNAARFIWETLDSALAQDYPNLEVIVSDDASTDDTPKIVAGYEGKGVRLLKQAKNLGRTGNMNAVTWASRGKYVVRLDADDILERQFVSSLVPVLEAYPWVSFAHCACRLIDTDGKSLGYERSIHGSFLRSGLEEWPRYLTGPRAVSMLIMRRRAFEEIGGYDDSYSYSQDWKLERDLLRVGGVYYHDQVLARYRWHSVGKSRIAFMQAQDNLKHLKDMERLWPLEVPDKERLLRKVRRHLAFCLIHDVASAEPPEASQLLQYLPLYGNFLDVNLMLKLIRLGGSRAYRRYFLWKLHLRQAIKNIFYKI